MLAITAHSNATPLAPSPSMAPTKGSGDKAIVSMTSPAHSQPTPQKTEKGETASADAPQDMNSFLHSVQLRALRMAQLAAGNPDDAQDIVQDTMTKLVQLYSDKQWSDWRPLFFRILSSRINDFHRRRAVQNRLRVVVERLKPAGNDDNQDPFSYVPAGHQSTPDFQLGSERRIHLLEAALRKLPSRQQQAFMLRCWEGLSTRDSAFAMKCSEGSVKTHYFRALKALRTDLEGY